MSTPPVATQINLRRDAYPQLWQSLRDLSEADRVEGMRWLARTDLWFLLRFLMNRRDLEEVDRPDWLFDRVRDVQNEPDGYLDLWAREHYKSTIITFAKTIQDILRYYGEDPLPGWQEPVFCIFSHTRPIAKAFLRQIRGELTFNDALKELFPDILYPNPERQASKWGDDDGIIVRRQSNPKESTVEAWGLVDSQPTSKHFNFLLYDDTVSQASVGTADMIRKTTEAWELSLNLGAGEDYVERYIGTRYHFADTYSVMLKRKAAEPRIHPCTDSGKVAGIPVMRSRGFLDERYRKMGPYTFSSQMLQNPIADTTQGFKREWLRYYDPMSPADAAKMNRYILVDPANEKKKNSDWTAMAVIGLAPDENMYLLDCIRDRMNLLERTKALIDLHRKWKVRGRVGYEKYGKDADIDHIKETQKAEGYRFDIKPLGGSLKKEDRIARLIPFAADQRLYLPTGIHRTIYDGTTHDLINILVEEEMMPFPVGTLHEDLLDAITRIYDMDMTWPKFTDPGEDKRRDRYGDNKKSHSWMSS